MDKRKLIILAGPTAVGKTSTSIRLAKSIGGEIISADSMQVYKHMDIGSAKISKEEMDGVPHYLVDVLDPKDDFNVARFQSMAKEAMDTIYSHGNIPILVGGTGFYIQSILYDVDFKEEESSSYRKELELILEKEGSAYLYRELEKIDPEAAKEIHPNNSKRVIRAIEYFNNTGEKISDHNKKEREKESPYDASFFVLHDDRDLLYERIDARVDQMLEDGLVEEVQALRDMGLDRSYNSMQGLGYKEILSYLDGEMSLDEAVYLIKRDTRHFAKRQITWFKREPSCIWLRKSDFSDVDTLVKVMKEYIFHE